MESASASLSTSTSTSKALERYGVLKGRKYCENSTALCCLGSWALVAAPFLGASLSRGKQLWHLFWDQVVDFEPNATSSLPTMVSALPRFQRRCMEMWLGLRFQAVIPAFATGAHMRCTQRISLPRSRRGISYVRLKQTLGSQPGKRSTRR